MSEHHYAETISEMMKKLVAIAIAAIAAVALVIYFGGSAETTVAPTSEREQPQTPTRDASTDMTDAGTQLASTDSESSPPVAAPLTDEERQRAACAALWERRRAREQAAIDAETKDPAWAYPMEQKLQKRSRKCHRRLLRSRGPICGPAKPEAAASATAGMQT